jgi:hypothetical protein
LRLRGRGIPALNRRPWPFERGQKWPLQRDVGTSSFARLQNIFNGVLHEQKQGFSSLVAIIKLGPGQ